MKNDRAKELFKEALLESYLDFHIADREAIMEKFAELIVRECADIAKTAAPYSSDDLILKHFGVKND
jgi:hypothetical protein